MLVMAVLKVDLKFSRILIFLRFPNFGIKVQFSDDRVLFSSHFVALKTPTEDPKFPKRLTFSFTAHCMQ